MRAKEMRERPVEHDVTREVDSAAMRVVRYAVMKMAMRLRHAADAPGTTL